MVRPRGGSRRKLERVVEALDEPVEAQPIAEEVPQAPLRLYAIRSTGSGQFKIGIPKHPESRLQELQVGSPIRLEIVSLTDIESPGAEREAHRALASYRLRGEWFDFGPLGEYVAGRLRPKASNLDALVAALREIRGVVIPARTACGLSRDDAAPNDPEPRWARRAPRQLARPLPEIRNRQGRQIPNLQTLPRATAVPVKAVGYAASGNGETRVAVGFVTSMNV